MRIPLMWLLCALAGACAGAEPEGGGAGLAPGEIFRTVELERGSVNLGEPVRGKAALGALVGDTLVRLHEGSFGGAAAILLHLGPGDTLRAMTFEYGREEDFPSRVAGYEKLLGPPARRSQRGAAGAGLTDVAVWEDRRTRFELHWQRRPGGAVSRGVLTDRSSHRP